MQTNILILKTTCSHSAHQKGEMRQPSFTFSLQIFAFHVQRVTIILLQAESKADKIDLWDQSSREKKLKNKKNQQSKNQVQAIAGAYNSSQKFK